MVKPYSQDLRERVIGAVEDGELSRREAARRYRVSVASAVRWLQQYRQSGRVKARPMGGDRRSVLKPVRTWLLKLVVRKPDLTLIAISRQLKDEHGITADASMLCRFFKAEGFSFKKTVHASEQLRADVALARQEWRERQGVLAHGRLFFIDETGAATNMVRRYGRAPRGERVKGYAPNGHWRTTTFVAALTAQGFVAPLVIDCPMNGAIFVQYVRQFLVPELTSGDIVILDNLSSHKSAEASQLIKACGAELLFLPPYSPDLNPIEMAFAKLKGLLRIAAERTRESLWQQIGKLIDQFSHDECLNYIRHAGYDAS
jgi:transposase